ncbi:hypothetical protein BCY86_01075 [Pajaroellobacter abortibovis]|uniref:Uncharacterized protein n=1 Tax=Pajaroellobacter abortibovis TaxID=1882918 RepID=A0A1L6MV90_9BACT|nr:hypothetical protein BCY86_01075 [Pajaroellobacter abortibovis]
MSIPYHQSIAVDQSGSVLFMAIDTDFFLFIDYLDVKIMPVKKHLSVDFSDSVVRQRDVISLRIARCGNCFVKYMFLWTTL